MCILKCLVRRVAGTRHGRNQASSVRLRIDVVRVAWYGAPMTRLIDVVRVVWYGAPMTRLVLYAGFFVRVSEHLSVVMYLGVGIQRTRWSVALSCHARPRRSLPSLGTVEK